jgi:hypothetical protein
LVSYLHQNEFDWTNILLDLFALGWGKQHHLVNPPLYVIILLCFHAGLSCLAVDLMLCHSAHRFFFVEVHIACQVPQFSLGVIQLFVTLQFLFCLIKVLIFSLILYVELFYYRFCYEIDDMQEAPRVANLGEGGKNLCKLGYHNIIT